MTPDEFARRMLLIAGPVVRDGRRVPGDEEVAHCDMDDLMLSVLRELGYGDGCDIFENTNKWYA